MKKWMLCLMMIMMAFSFVGYVCAGTAESTGTDGSVEIADGKTSADEAFWVQLTASDEAFWDNMTYTPVMQLDTNGDIETWLVSFCSKPVESAEDEAEPETGYLVQYIQMTPYPKVIGTTLVGEPLKENTPACEIKLQLTHDQVLDDNYLPTDSIREKFQIQEDFRTIDVVYLETPDREYQNSGWINRIRVKDDKARYELTYKIRYAVEDDNLEAALTNARADGFSLYDTQFEAEFDWNYAGMALSFSADVNLKMNEVPDMDLLSKEDAIRMITDNMPSEEKNWNQPDWGIQMADDLQVTVPVHYQRYSGTLGEQSITLEIWQMPDGDETQVIVELSTKCDSVEEAAPIREELIETLEEMGVLIHSDAPKTQIVLDGLERTE